MTHVNVKLTHDLKKYFAAEQLDLAVDDLFSSIDKGQYFDNTELTNAIMASKKFLIQDVEQSLLNMSSALDVLVDSGQLEEATELEARYMELLETLCKLRK